VTCACLAANIAADLLPLAKPIAELVPDPANVRRHGDKNLAAIRGSLAAFQQRKNVVLQRRPDGTLIVRAGNGTLAAAIALEWTHVAAIIVDEGDTTATAFAIADNRTAELAEWDPLGLGNTLKALQGEGFDLAPIGFDDDDLAALIPKTLPPPPGEGDEDKVPDKVETRCKPGDLWILGGHRLLCGDATNVQHVERLIAGVKVDMVYTDPPYGIAYAGKGITSKFVKGNDFGAIRGDDTIDAAIDAFNLCKTLDVPVMVWWGANFYCSALDDRCSWIIWDKQIVGDFYSACELAWTNLRGRLRMFVHKWHGMVKGSEHGQARVHPTQKPIALAEWCIAQLAPEAERVLDLFLGSGSTLIACEKTGRRCFGMEIDPAYCDVVLSRWEAFTGKTAQRESGDAA
jgi:hypothetical protein